MKKDIIIYHGSQQIIEVPKFGIGKKYCAASCQSLEVRYHRITELK